MPGPFRKPRHWSIGVKGPAPQGHALAHYLRQFMQRWQLTPPDGKLRYLAHMLPTRAPGTPLVRERALVLGDAAGLLEPFTGEGIYYALRSAYLAAEALTAASVSDTSPWSYEAAVDTEIMPDLAGAAPCSRCSMPGPGFFIAWCGPTSAPGEPSPRFCAASVVFAMSSRSCAVILPWCVQPSGYEERGVGEGFAS